MDKESLSSNVEKLSLIARFLGLLEQILPAFLVAWNNQLKQKNKQLELKLEKAGIEAEVIAKKEAISNESQDPSVVIDKFLQS